MTMTMQHYDAAIIGTGQGGYPLAKALAAAGWQTAVIERGDVGGSCVNVGCTPTKTMVASARVAYLARRGSEYGVRTGPISVDMQTIRGRKQAIVADFRDGSRRSLERTENLDLIFGEARFTEPKALEINLREGGTLALTADKVFINTGTQPRTPDIEGLDEIPWLDHASLMELDEVPEHLLVLGGGYVGLEFGQMFRRFGSDVTIIQRNSQLLPREDEDVAEEIARILREDGIEVLLGAEATRASRTPGGRVRLTVKTPEGERTLEGSHLLVAVGRVPSSDLNLESAGVETDDRGFIKHNERLETTAPDVYVIGDVKGGPAFTHISYDDYRVLKATLLEGKRTTIEGRLVPYTVFIDPQLGRVGLTEREAHAQGLSIKVAKLPMTHVARALEMDETRGFMKAIVDAETDQILGCAVLSVEGGEVMSVLQMAIMGRVPYTAIRDGVFAHPTLAESLNNLFMALDG
jgi:pyruvate/2-oxoglutarate dehydrogenase complex dihydrolipoamide dehydrogenase (E3) component